MGALEQSETIIKDSLNLFEDSVLLNCKSGAEYLLMQLQPFHNTFLDLLSSYHSLQLNKDALNQNNENMSNFLKFLSKFSNLVSETIVSGKITSLTAAALQQAEVLADSCRNSGHTALKLIDKMKSNQDIDINSDEAKELDSLVDKILQTLKELLPKVHDINKEELGDLIDQEMHKTSEAIEAAVAKLEVFIHAELQFIFFYIIFSINIKKALMNKSKEKDTGMKLEVNDKILDSCTALMKAIKILIQKSKELQKEIVAQGRVS